MQASRKIQMMGTVIELLIEDEQAEQKIEQVHQLLNLYNHRFSANDPESELSKINQQASIGPVQVHPQLFELIQIGKKESLAKPSNLNIAIGPIVQTWRIGFPDAKLPKIQEIADFLELCQPENIILDKENLTVFLKKKGMKIDLGALAKGYIADLIMQEIHAKSILINLGGNVLVSGKNPNRETGEWKIGIQSPGNSRGEHIGLLAIEGGSVVTSGIYERTFQLEGKTYHHIFDEQTGFPIKTDMASLTIVANHSLTCEIWTTRLFGLPVAEALWQIEQNPEIEGIVITQEGQVLPSQNLKAKFILY
ncbi:MAG: FAD:protein FMN transferase [Streptococcaceae bacterium]|nr:FAD:protein FMN transferase [Streptococcaceae bacterium]